LGSVINQNSFLLLIVFVWVIAVVVLLRKGWDRRSLVLLGGITVALTGVFFIVRPASVDNDPAADLRAQIGVGKPVLLEFRSQN
jgi:hypothetical protein